MVDQDCAALQPPIIRVTGQTDRRVAAASTITKGVPRPHSGAGCHLHNSSGLETTGMVWLPVTGWVRRGEVAPGDSHPAIQRVSSALAVPVPPSCSPLSYLPVSYKLYPSQQELAKPKLGFWQTFKLKFLAVICLKLEALQQAKR